jgi:hypothetical protein
LRQRAGHGFGQSLLVGRATAVPFELVHGLRIFDRLARPEAARESLFSFAI